MAFVFDFDHKHRKAPRSMKDLLGGKGANLAEMMTVLKLPVPYGFTVTTDASRHYMRSGWPASLDREISAHIATLEAKMGRKLGD
ncbi:MAG: PEP/pyruvate-binding domain-containing protein, partial [Ilumatobacteraceae bacterium]